MKKILFFFCLFVFFKPSTQAGDGEYAVSKIPVNLLKNAGAVIRIEEQNVELKNLEKMVIHEHWVITILNEKADYLAAFSKSYDKFNSIEFIEGKLYDANGAKIKSLKKNEIQDLSSSSEMDIGDNRYKVHNFYYKVYPYTIEYTVEVTQKETMFFPQWLPVRDAFIAVEKSSINIEVPADYKLRYLALNFNQEPVISSKENIKNYSWHIENYEAIVDESFSPSWKKIAPCVITAPSEFSIENYHGTMTDWKELGLFQVSLNKGRDVLPDAIKRKVHQLINDVDDKKDKVFRLYKYLQQNTRYISIQLGVGGWRPYEASYVSLKGYGDCKALSNYMYSLLKEAGILSYYTLIRGGNHEDDIEVDFPSRQFNHVIICVPDAKDTIWLECTSQTVSPGYMGKFTGNRHALLITEDGGKIVSTPVYRMNDNLQIRKIKALLDDEGTLTLKANTHYTGLQQDYIHGMIHELSKDKVKEFLHEDLNFATYDINSFDYKEENSWLPAINESLDLTVSGYAARTGKRIFIMPNLMNKAGYKLNQVTARKYDIELNTEYKDVDSVERIAERICYRNNPSGHFNYQQIWKIHMLR